MKQQSFEMLTKFVKKHPKEVHNWQDCKKTLTNSFGGLYWHHWRRLYCLILENIKYKYFLT